MGDSNSIGGQVMAELSGIAKDVVKGTVDVGTGVFETALGGSGGQSGQQQNTPMDVEKTRQKEVEKKRRYNQVLNELEEYRKRRNVQVRQEEQKEMQEQQEVAFKKSEKAKKDEEFIKSIQRQYSGGNEAAKQVG